MHSIAPIGVPTPELIYPDLSGVPRDFVLNSFVIQLSTQMASAYYPQSLEACLISLGCRR